MTMTTPPNNLGHLADTSFTKVFVGGLAWETPKETLKDHFDPYGDILEAVIISDKLTGRSKGYGFVTFKEAEAAKRACEDASPVINGRRANCNLASLGARRSRELIKGEGGNGGAKSSPAPAPQASHVQWYYPPATTPYHHQHQYPHPLPYFGYTPAAPAYVSTNVGYNHKVSYSCEQYYNPGVQQVMVGANTLMPLYAHHHHHHHPGAGAGAGVYYHHHHQSQQLGLPPAAQHIYSSPFPTPITKLPVILSKPTPVCLAVE